MTKTDIATLTDGACVYEAWCDLETEEIARRISPGGNVDMCEDE